MKKFLNFITEEEVQSPVVFSFGRMNPGPTIGHQKLIDTVRGLANKMDVHHEIVLSHSQDNKKNPLSVDQKLEHARRLFPDTNFVGASKDQPTLMHHAARLHAAGHDHLIMVAGSDRVDEYKKLLNTYNGKPDRNGKVPFNFKKIDVVSSGERDPDSEGAEGMSASKMREHAKANNFSAFRKGLPSHVENDHARQIFNDTRAGLGLNESFWRRFKDWMREDFGGMMSGEGGVRGLGMVTGDVSPDNNNRYVSGNVADFDDHTSVLSAIKKAHHDVHHETKKEKKNTRK